MGDKKTKVLRFDIGEGRSIELPVAEITGDAPGPSAVVTAGLHGCEYDGIFAAIRLFREISPSDVKGSIKFITVCDTALFENGCSSLTTDGEDLNRCFPGRAGGSYGETLAAKIIDEIKGADYHIDLHSTLPMRVSVPVAAYHRGRRGELNDMSHEIAYYYGMPHIVITETDSRWPDKGTFYASVYEKIGIPSALVRTGSESGDANKHRHIAGITNVLRRFGTLKGSTIAVGRPQIYEGMEWLYAKHPGLYISAVKIDEKVRRGQMLGYVADCFGTPVEKILSPINGRVLCHTDNSAVGEGGFVVCVALLR